MKKHEKGQGLVEYFLILELVAIVVVAVLNILGPSIGGAFCAANYSLLKDDPKLPPLVVSMDINDPYLNIDVKQHLNGNGVVGCGDHVSEWHKEIGPPPYYGELENKADGTYTYTPNEGGSDTDDSFLYRVTYDEVNYDLYGEVTIIVGDEDVLAKEKSILPIVEQTAPILNEVDERILTLWEESAAQEESIKEGVGHSIEAVVEGLEVLIEFAKDDENQVLAESLSQLRQAVKDGNQDGVEAVITSLAGELADFPIDVWIAMSLKEAPRLINACVTMSEGKVSPDTIFEALQAVEQIDEEHPRKTEIVQLLQEVVNVIEDRNSAMEEYSNFHHIIISQIITALETVGGYDDLVAQFAADSAVCSY
jgi:pilus assembly protein Flp/PilA